MFVVDRGELLKVIVEMQRQKCAYDPMSMGLKDRKPAEFCDCKYGYKNEHPYSEQTGCPELRCVVLLLNGMSDKVYNGIMKKMGGIQFERISTYKLDR